MPTALATVNGKPVKVSACFQGEMLRHLEFKDHVSIQDGAANVEANPAWLTEVDEDSVIEDEAKPERQHRRSRSGSADESG